MHRAITAAAKDKRRSTLLDASLDEFYECGFSAARMDNIAKRAGVSKGTIYLYFESKDALFTNLVEDLTQPNVAQIEAIANNTTSVKQLVEGFADFAPKIVDNPKMPRLLKVLIGDSQAFPEIVENYRTNVIEHVLKIVTKIFTQAKKRGEINIDDPALTARLLIAPLMMSGMWIAVFGNKGDAAFNIEKLMKNHADILLRAFYADGPNI